MPLAHRVFAVLAVAAFVSAPSALVKAQTAQIANGSDTFVSASSGQADVQASGDVFASGAALVLKGRVAGDAHVTGFDLDVNSDVEGDLYAAGAALAVNAPVRGDLSLLGFSLRTSDMASVAGNARMLAGSIMIDGAIGGALSAVGGEITLNAPVTGNVLLQAERINFGPKARIGGTLIYAAPAATTIPKDVIPPERVTFQEIGSFADRFDGMRRWGSDWHGRDMPMFPGTAALAIGFLLSLAFLILLGGAFLWMVPGRIETMRLRAIRQPAFIVLLGLLGLATTIGLIPVTAMTIIGLPFVPIVVLAVLALWALGYVLGVYILAMRLFQAFADQKDPTPGLRIGILAGGLIVMALLNFVPVLGWMVNFGIVLFGVGALSTASLRALARRIPDDQAADMPDKPIA